MKKVMSFVIIITLMMGCNKNNEKYPQEIDIAFFKENDIIFRNDEFKNLLNELIKKQPIVPSNGNNSILVYLSLYKKDTLMILINSQPFEREELKAYHYYNSYRIHFYAPKELENKLETLIEYNKIKSLIKHKMKIKPYPNVIYQAPYIINGNEIELFNFDEKSINEIFPK